MKYLESSEKMRSRRVTPTEWNNRVPTHDFLDERIDIGQTTPVLNVRETVRAGHRIDLSLRSELLVAMERHGYHKDCDSPKRLRSC